MAPHIRRPHPEDVKKVLATTGMVVFALIYIPFHQIFVVRATSNLPKHVRTPEL